MICGKQVTLHFKRCISSVAFWKSTGKLNVWNFRFKQHVLRQHTHSLIPKDFPLSLHENSPLHFKMNGHKKNKRVNISVNDTSVKDKDLSKLNMCLFYYVDVIRAVLIYTFGYNSFHKICTDIFAYPWTKVYWFFSLKILLFYNILIPKDFPSSLPENSPLHFKMNGHKKNKRVNISVNDTSVKDKD
jgi:hypothetical protein